MQIKMKPKVVRAAAADREEFAREHAGGPRPGAAGLAVEDGGERPARLADDGVRRRRSRCTSGCAANLGPTLLGGAGDASTRCRRDGKLLVFGNGGSAADAQHLAAELVGRFQRERAALPAIALTTDTSMLTSDRERLLVRRRCSRGRSRRSGSRATWRSGSRPAASRRTCVAALQAARARGLTTIALTGRDGGSVGRAAEIHVNVPDQSHRARAGSAPDAAARDVRVDREGCQR